MLRFSFFVLFIWDERTHTQVSRTCCGAGMEQGLWGEEWRSAPGSRGRSAPRIPEGRGGERDCRASEWSSSRAALGGRQNDRWANGGQTALFCRYRPRGMAVVKALWTQDFVFCRVHLGRGRSLQPGVTLAKSTKTWVCLHLCCPLLTLHHRQKIQISETPSEFEVGFCVTVCETFSAQPRLLLWMHIKISNLGLPGGPVVKTPSFQCPGLGFSPWWGN